mgnify:CR=1 FL=1
MFKKSFAVNPKVYLKVVRPNLLFKVQRAFQDRGITFVNLSNGQLIKGNVNTDTLGMVRDIRAISQKATVGFPVKHKDSYSHTDSQPIFNVEATINIFEPKKTKYPVIFTIRVVNQDDLEYWYNLSEEIGLGFLKLVWWRPKPTAIFHIVPLTSPDQADPDSSISTMLSLIQGYQTEPSGNVYAVSNISLDLKKR